MTIHTPHPSGGSQPAETNSVAQNLAFLHSTVAASSLRHGSGGHEAGRNLSSFSSWSPPLRSSDANVLGDIAPVKAKTRDLMSNHGFAQNAKMINRDNVVGPGLRLALAIDHILLNMDKDEARDWSRMVQRRWDVYANGIGHHADARRIMTFNQMTRIVGDSIFEDGEALSVRIWRKPKVGQTAGTAFQLINSDRLSNPNNVPDRPGLRGGVYYNEFKEPTHYAIREAHPSDGKFGEFNKIHRWKKIKREGATGARLVMHIFDHDHAEMTRGISAFVTAIKPLKMLSKYKDVTLERAIIQAIFAATIKSELSYSDAMQVMGQSFGQKMAQTGVNPMTAMTIDHMGQAAAYHKKAGHNFDGAQLQHLLPNEEIELHRAEGADNNFDVFEKNVLREIAAGTGTPIASLSQNYADANYSSLRASLLDIWRHYLSKRQMIIDGWCWPAFGAWLEEEIMTGAINLPKGVSDFYQSKDYLMRGKWYGVAKPMLDEYKERRAQVIGKDLLGVQSGEDIAASEGKDIEEIEDQREREDHRALERLARRKAVIEKLKLTDEDLGENTPAAAKNTPAKTEKKSKKKELEDA